MNLADFLYDTPRDPRPWNCSTFPADWCIALGHFDFAEPWRHIVEPEDCERAAECGLVSLWEVGILNAIPLASPPFLAGDIAVISKAGLEAGAIFDGERWALRTARGVAFASLPDTAVLKAWRPWQKP